MDTLAYTMALVAGLIHGYIFYVQAIIWKKPKAHRLFGVRSDDEAEVLASVMFNQGFYNLFLGLGAVGGALMGYGGSSNGEILTLFTMAFMTGAALVLIGSRLKMVRGALIQGLLPAISIVLLLVA